MDKNTSDGPPGCGDHAGAGFPQLDDRDYACLLLPDLDYDAQLRAIHNLLRLHRRASGELGEEIREIDAYARRSVGLRNERAVDEWLDRMHASVYQDAAHSMAAVGMLAPLVESIFHQALCGVRERVSSAPSNHDRWQHPGDKRRPEWDCHFIWNGSKWEKDLVKGIRDLADAVGLSRHLPEDLMPKLQALFRYRNRMFHHGFEWPMDERENFCRSDWPDHWFSAATSGGNPWVFYMTDVFIDECVNSIAQTIEAIGAFARRMTAAGAAHQTDAADRPPAGH
jgi:hypothetical protein